MSFEEWYEKNKEKLKERARILARKKSKK